MTGLVAGAGVKAALGGVPRWAWYAIGGVAAAIALFFLHLHFVHNYRDKVITANNTAWQKKLDAAHAEALAWVGRFNRSQAKLAQEIRNRHEETLRSNATLAGGLLVRGPGAARCGQSDHSSVPAAASGHGAVSRPAGAPVARLSDQERIDLIALPFAPAVSGAQVCDDNRSEVISWREWYTRNVAAWPK